MEKLKKDKQTKKKKKQSNQFANMTNSDADTNLCETKWSKKKKKSEINFD